MTEPDTTTVNGQTATSYPLPDGLQRVFVGIPDVLTGEQFARLHAINVVFASDRFSSANSEDPTGDRLANAARVAEFILNGPAS